MLVDNFGSYSGLQPNINKTQGLWLGNLEHAHIGGIKWSLDVKALGVWFGKDQIKCELGIKVKSMSQTYRNLEKTQCLRCLGWKIRKN